MTRIRIALVGTGHVARALAQEIRNDHRFQIIGFANDPGASCEQQRTFSEDMSALAIAPFDLTSLARTPSDIVLLNECQTIIREPALFDRLTINVHSGILPNYRGLHANGWALLNGEKEIGYSLHRVTPEVDAGDIYLVRSMAIGQRETYSEFKPRMLADLYKRVPDTLAMIHAGAVTAAPQRNATPLYCSLLRADDAILDDLDQPAHVLSALYRIFAPPLGTGLYTYRDGVRVELRGVWVSPGSIPYIGVTGAVVAKHPDGSVEVKARGSTVTIDTLVQDSRVSPAASTLRLGERLGNRNPLA